VTETASIVSVRNSCATWARSATLKRRKSAGVAIVSSRGVLEGVIVLASLKIQTGKDGREDNTWNPALLQLRKGGTAVKMSSQFARTVERKTIANNVLSGNVKPLAQTAAAVFWRCRDFPATVDEWPTRRKREE
jgi:hypothetical protein